MTLPPMATRRPPSYSASAFSATCMAVGRSRWNGIARPRTATRRSLAAGEHVIKRQFQSKRAKKTAVIVHVCMHL
jgi:hypothetical protein